MATQNSLMKWRMNKMEAEKKVMEKTTAQIFAMALDMHDRGIVPLSEEDENHFRQVVAGNKLTIIAETNNGTIGTWGKAEH